jgi:response regulator NasT
MGKITAFKTPSRAGDTPVEESRPISILVVDDEEDLVALLTREIRSLHHRVAGKARNGQQAVELARKLRPDLIIMDIGMPVMDGIDATHAIQQTQKMPIVISTGSSDELTLGRLKNLTIGGYLVKPFSPAQLKVVLHLAMSSHVPESESAEFEPPAARGAGLN